MLCFSTESNLNLRKFFGKNQNGFLGNRSTTSQILTINRVNEGVRAKNLGATQFFIDISKAFDSIHRGNVEPILLAKSLLKKLSQL